MARVLVEKQVLFSGIWRPRHLDDEFLRTVSKEFAQKPSAQATWRLSTEGVIILVSQSATGKVGQTDLIPITSIKEVTVNRYNPLCLMTIYVDPNRRFNALVCKCQSEKDAAEIVHDYLYLRKSISGEGYRIDLKQPQGINWTLKNSQNGQRDVNANVTTEVINGHGTGHHPSRQSSLRSQGRSVAPGVGVFAAGRPGERVLVEVEQEELEREPMRTEEGLQGFNVGVQAELDDHDSDIESTASDMSLQSLKDELYSLSTEVREIKKLLARSQGISTEEYFRREQDGPRSSQIVPVKRSVSHDSDGHSSGEKRVNFASDSEDMDFDIRSVGMQTDKSRIKYIKRARAGTAPVRYRQVPFRPRTDSNASSQAPTNPAMVSPAVSYDPNHFSYVNHGHRIVHQRRDPRLTGESGPKGGVPQGGTVMRSIESVYQTGPRRKRGQIIVMPQRAATIGPVRASVQKSFPPEASRPPTGNGVHPKPAPAPPTDAGNGARPKAAGNGIVPGGRAPVASQ